MKKLSKTFSLQNIRKFILWDMCNNRLNIQVKNIQVKSPLKQMHLASQSVCSFVSLSIYQSLKLWKMWYRTLILKLLWSWLVPLAFFLPLDCITFFCPTQKDQCTCGGSYPFTTPFAFYPFLHYSATSSSFQLVILLSISSGESLMHFCKDSQKVLN